MAVGWFLLAWMLLHGIALLVRSRFSKRSGARLRAYSIGCAMLAFAVATWCITFSIAPDIGPLVKIAGEAHPFLGSLTALSALFALSTAAVFFVFCCIAQLVAFMSSWAYADYAFIS